MTPLLPLDNFRSILGFHPAHFWGVAGENELTAIRSNCPCLVRQYAWQLSDAVGRHEIAQAIETAEARLREWLGYSVAPRYTVETLAWPSPWPGDGRWQTVQLSEGYVQAAGIESLAAIGAAAVVAYSDVDGDGLDETFTISAATTVTDVKEIAVYFAAADRFDGPDFTDDVGDRWRIQPISITIAGGTVTVKGSKWLLVKPILHEGFTNVGANGLEPTTVGNFVTTLDIYRRTTGADGTTAATSQGVIVWETEPHYSCCGNVSESSAYSGSPYDPAAVAQAVARVGIRDSEHGIVAPAEASYNTTTGIWSALDWTVCAWPDRVTVRTLSGYPLDADGQMARQWRTIVARLAAAELARPVCGCEEANRELYYWQFDLSRTGASDELFAAPADLDNPFGSRRGHLYAWRQVKNLRQLRGFLA